jgi:hypothetical protein
MKKINAVTVPKGRNFINRRLQPTDRRTSRSNKPCKGDTWGEMCRPCGTWFFELLLYRKLKHTVNKVLSLRDKERTNLRLEMTTNRVIPNAVRNPEVRNPAVRK